MVLGKVPRMRFHAPTRILLAETHSVTPSEAVAERLPPAFRVCVCASPKSEKFLGPYMLPRSRRPVPSTSHFDRSVFCWVSWIENMPPPGREIGFRRKDATVVGVQAPGHPGWYGISHFWHAMMIAGMSISRSSVNTSQLPCPLSPVLPCNLSSGRKELRAVGVAHVDLGSIRGHARLKKNPSKILSSKVGAFPRNRSNCLSDFQNLIFTKTGL